MADLDQEQLQKYSEEFDQICQVRHETGAVEYGSLTFMQAPLFDMVVEELADAANYLRYMYIKLRVVEENLSARGVDLSAVSIEEVWPQDEVSPNSSSFVPSEKLQGFLPRKERKR